MSTEMIFFSVVNGKLFISVNGLSFTDVLYASNLDKVENLQLKIDTTYSTLLKNMQITTVETFNE